MTSSSDVCFGPFQAKVRNQTWHKHFKDGVEVPCPDSHTPTVQQCTRCGEMRPYSDQWVETIARKGSKVQWSSLECWDCFLERVPE